MHQARIRSWRARHKPLRSCKFRLLRPNRIDRRELWARHGRRCPVCHLFRASRCTSPSTAGGSPRMPAWCSWPRSSETSKSRSRWPASSGIHERLVGATQPVEMLGTSALVISANYTESRSRAAPPGQCRVTSALSNRAEYQRSSPSSSPLAKTDALRRQPRRPFINISH